MAERLEEAGEYDRAEQIVLHVIEELDIGRDRAMIGALHLNLGSISRGWRPWQATYDRYQNAIRLLDGLKGDSVLQSAHAHFHCARLLLAQEEDAVPELSKAREHARTAVELLGRHPFARLDDLLEAEMALVLIRTELEKEFDADACEGILERALEVEVDGLERELFQRLLANYVLHVRAHRLSRRVLLSEVSRWAGQELMREVLRDVRPRAVALARHQLLREAPRPGRDPLAWKGDRTTSPLRGEDAVALATVAFESVVFVAGLAGRAGQDELERLFRRGGPDYPGGTGLPHPFEVGTGLAAAIAEAKQLGGLKHHGVLRSRLRDRLDPSDYQVCMARTFIDIWSFAVTCRALTPEVLDRFLAPFAEFWGLDMLSVPSTLLPGQEPLATRVEIRAWLAAHATRHWMMDLIEELFER